MGQIKNIKLHIVTDIKTTMDVENSKSEKPQLEVEQKFRVPDNYKSVFEIAGGELLSEKLLIDIYFDTESFQLLSQDVWLRKRGDNLELKIPTVSGHKGDGMFQYREVEGRRSVLQELSQFTSRKFEELVELVRVEAVREEWP